MGIDLDKGGRGKSRNSRNTRTTDVYLKLLIKVFFINFSFILSYQEELKVNSTKLYLKDFKNQESKDIL